MCVIPTILFQSSNLNLKETSLRNPSKISQEKWAMLYCRPIRLQLTDKDQTQLLTSLRQKLVMSFPLRNCTTTQRASGTRKLQKQSRTQNKELKKRRKRRAKRKTISLLSSTVSTVTHKILQRTLNLTLQPIYLSKLRKKSLWSAISALKTSSTTWCKRVKMLMSSKMK